ncbi:ATP-binding cassette domain-containing protein [Streptomyces sp. NPDC059766]|uniref:branched-chain amino acid ABC transporter ATP-binding protein/permease n=1 Tax=Streptomyces sp. NPDC059766 TaxID=3346940 RepID=UPI003654C9EE
MSTPSTGGAVASAVRRAGRTPRWLGPAVPAVLLLCLPWLGVGPYWTRQVILISVLAMVVSGLNLSWGYAGELSMGQAALYAVGAYVGATLTVHGVDLVIALVAAAASAALVGCVSGIPGLRLGGWGLAMMSFFLVLLVPDVVEIFAGTTGGKIGMVGIPRPVLFGSELDDTGFYLVVVSCLLLWTLVMRNLVTSREGSKFRILRQSPVLAGSLGINVAGTKLRAYTIGAIPAGIAGCLFGLLDGFINPDYFSMELAIAVIAASVVGGSETVYGALLGAAILQLGPMQATSFDRYALVAYGAFLVLGGVFLAGGITGVAQRLFGRFTARFRTRTIAARAAAKELRIAPIPGERLEARGIVKDFGGARALDHLDFVAEPGSVTGLIGANGSGKTTLLNIVSGFYVQTEGVVVLDGVDLGTGSPHLRARRGVARTFQTPLVPRSMTTADVVASARIARHRCGTLPSVLRLPRYWRTKAADRTAALEALQVVGLEHLADEPASSLALGTRRLVEVARALAAEPAVLLLDEPASGLDEHEVADLNRLIRRVSEAGATVVLVEHNFDLVCDVSDRIYVLETGRLIANGTPDEVRTDPAVIATYLGSSGSEPLADASTDSADAGSLA